MTLCKCAQPKQLFPVWKNEEICLCRASQVPTPPPSPPLHPHLLAGPPTLPQTFSHQLSSFVTCSAPGNNIAWAPGSGSHTTPTLNVVEGCLSGWVVPVLSDLGCIWLAAQPSRRRSRAGVSLVFPCSLPALPAPVSLSPFCFERTFIPSLLA